MNADLEVAGLQCQLRRQIPTTYHHRSPAHLAVPALLRDSVTKNLEAAETAAVADDDNDDNVGGVNTADDDDDDDDGTRVNLARVTRQPDTVIQPHLRYSTVGADRVHRPRSCSDIAAAFRPFPPPFLSDIRTERLHTDWAKSSPKWDVTTRKSTAGQSYNSTRLQLTGTASRCHPKADMSADDVRNLASKSDRDRPRNAG